MASISLARIFSIRSLRAFNGAAETRRSSLIRSTQRRTSHGKVAPRTTRLKTGAFLGGGNKKIEKGDSSAKEAAIVAAPSDARLVMARDDREVLSEVSDAVSSPLQSQPTTTASTLAEDISKSGPLRKYFTFGLKWWLPISPLEGYSGVAEAASRLWENTVLLSGLIGSLAGFAVIFPVEPFRDGTSQWAVAYAFFWSLSFGFCLAAAFSSTILLNKMCKCAPQNYSLWFKKFGGFVEVPVLLLYLGGWASFGGILAVLLPLYSSPPLAAGVVIMFVGCGYLVTSIYSQTTDFEKACTSAAVKYPGSGSAAEGGILEEYAKLTGMRDPNADGNP